MTFSDPAVPVTQADPGVQPGQPATAVADVELSSPVVGMPVSDFVRDGVALLLLALSLGLHWDIRHNVTGLPWVIAVTAVAALALTLPYAARAGLLPTAWSVGSTRRARLIAALPYVVLVLVYLVIDAVAGDVFSDDGGLGAGMALGLAAAVLVAQPRQCELGPREAEAKTGMAWRAAVLATAGLFAVVVLVSIVLTFTNDGGLGGNWTATFVLSGIAALAIVGLPVVGMAMGQESGRLLMVALGSTVAVAFAVRVAGNHVESMQAGIAGLVLVPALGAMAAAPAVRGISADRPAAEVWPKVAGWALFGATVAAATVAIVDLLRVTDGAEAAEWVTGMILGISAAGLAVWAAMVARSSRTVAVWIAVLVAVLGVVVLVDEVVRAGIGILLMSIWIGLAVTSVVALTVPRQVRAQAAAVAAANPAYRPTRAYVWEPPAVAPLQLPVPVPPPAPGTGFTPEQAANPATPLEVLAQIAADAPHLRPQIAANPSTYPALLEWLGNLQDPAVDAALRSRR